MSAAKETKSSISRKKRSKQSGWSFSAISFPIGCLPPPKRTTLLPDGANPVYDKEMRSEIFAQGTLMLRLVIQVSMFLAIPLMAVCLFWRQELAPWYICYVVLFNMLVGPVFSAGSVTERAGTANSRSAADHDHFAVANSVGKADRRAARFQRADGVFAVAAVAWPASCRRRITG